MKWSPQQDEALVDVARWLADGDQQVFHIFGFAGTGKTTLARHFAEGVSGHVMYGSFTGKAAYVLRQKGCANATTIHSMIYHVKDKARANLKNMEAQLTELRMELLGELSIEDRADSDTVECVVEGHRRVVEIRAMIEAERANLSRPMFTLNPDSEVRDASLLVLDEVSMLDGTIGADVLSFGTKVLVLGDPAQLPPVAGTGFFTHEVTPEVMLTDIHRQAAENPIIAMATLVRQEQALSLGSYGESLVVERADMDPSLAQEADQLLVGRNKTRHSYNQRMRELLGFTDPLPMTGDKLVCLRNNHELGLLNGAIWMVEEAGQIDDDRVFISIVPETEGEVLEVQAHAHHFQGRGDDLPWWDRQDAEEFDYGNALTVHKAQGSQWDRVVLFDESWCFRKDRWKWLYTGLTRAAVRVTVVKM